MSKRAVWHLFFWIIIWNYYIRGEITSGEGPPEVDNDETLKVSVFVCGIKGVTVMGKIKVWNESQTHVLCSICTSIIKPY